MSLPDQHEEKVRSAFAALVDATPVGVEFHELTDSIVAPSRPRQEASRVVVFGAAFLFVSLIGGLMVWANRIAPSAEETQVAAEHITWSQWLDQAMSKATKVQDSPLVFQGLAGPKPEFDLSPLGEEQRLAEVTDGRPVDWSLFESTTEHGPALVAGRIPGPIYVGTARIDSQNSRVRSDAGPQVCHFTIHDGSTSFLGLGCTSPDDPAHYGVVTALTDDPQSRADSIAVVTPPDASVVAVVTSEERLWQRPRGNMAVFLGNFTDFDIKVTIFDSQGNILHVSNPSDPLEHSLMANAVEIAEKEIFIDELEAVIGAEVGDRIFRVPVADHEVLARVRPSRNPHLYATSCDVLAMVILPPGWQGTCLERTVDGQRIHAEFDYSDLSN